MPVLFGALGEEAHSYLSVWFPGRSRSWLHSHPGKIEAGLCRLDESCLFSEQGCNHLNSHLGLLSGDHSVGASQAFIWGNTPSYQAR